MVVKAEEQESPPLLLNRVAINNGQFGHSPRSAYGGAVGSRERRTMRRAEDDKRRAERAAVARELGLVSRGMRSQPDAYQGRVGGFETFVNWSWFGSDVGGSGPITVVVVWFPDRARPRGLRMDDSVLYLRRPFFERLGHVDGSDRVVGAFRRRPLHDWLTPDRRVVLSSTRATNVTRRRLLMSASGHLEGLDHVVATVRALADDARRLA